jgi:CPA1 family monovalent cation:H+ antiporter
MQSTFQTISALLFLAAFFGFLNNRIFKLPRTIGILVLSLAFSVLLIGIDAAAPSLGIRTFASEHVEAAALPQALFGGALAFLMFAAALEVSFSDLWSRKGTIAVLATVGVVMTTLLMGLGMWQVFAVLGSPVPLVWCLVMGAAVAPTDPVAVMSALRRIGLPRDLQGMIAGESLFNDGVGIVVFTVLLAAATGSQTHLTAGSMAVDFVREALGGGALGLGTGYVAFAAMRRIDEHNVELMISIALVTATYSLAQAFEMSGPIAVVASGLFIGAQAKRHAMSERTRRHLDTVWSVFDEILNALLCLVIGLEILVLGIGASGSMALAAAIGAVLSLAVRFLSVSALAFLLYGRRTRRRAVIVLTWTGLRGGISMALALSMPDTAYRQPLLIVCYGIILFSMLVQGLTLERVASRLFPKSVVAHGASNDDPHSG